jgi:hypothetical protein
MGKDKCVMCSEETQYDFSTHIDLRTGYIEGVGQLCFNCYATGSARKQIIIDHRTIIDTPNDMELGAKVRSIFFESANIIPDLKWENANEIDA